MIAIAILSLVVSVAIPVYNGHRKEAAIAQAIKEIYQIEMQLKYWELDGTLPMTLAEVGLDMVDPWGKPYEYLPIAVTPPPSKGKVRKDKNLVPINTDFDLYSIGEDGETATPLTSEESHDDVVRAANGAFVGLGKDY
jgi:general secretion pathway protein G